MSRFHHIFARAFRGTTVVLAVGLSTVGTSAAIAQATANALVADCSAYASVPLPAEANVVPGPKTAPDCASYRSYRGIGRSVDYTKARACAWQERLAQMANLGQNQKEPIAWVVGGSLILSDIYLNGAGVERSISLALRLACEFDEGMAELAMSDIAKPDRSADADGKFELCDYAASTLTMSFCTAYSFEVEDDQRSRYYASLMPSMNQHERTAFDELLSAHDAYADSSVLEVNQAGSFRSLRTLEFQRTVKETFHADLVLFERDEWPSLSAKQIATANALLQREYTRTLQRLRNQARDSLDEGVVTADDLIKVQSAWKTYHDAWVRFARRRYPEAVEKIRAKISIDRHRLLENIP